MEGSAKKGKGTVTSLAAMFPAEDTQKAARRVQDKLAEMQPELDRVRGFISDNANLINLVQKLPEELHHDIMVNLYLLSLSLSLIVNKFENQLGPVWESGVLSGAFDTHKRSGGTIRRRLLCRKNIQTDGGDFEKEREWVGLSSRVSKGNDAGP